MSKLTRSGVDLSGNFPLAGQLILLFWSNKSKYAGKISVAGPRVKNSGYANVSSFRYKVLISADLAQRETMTYVSCAGKTTSASDAECLDSEFRVCVIAV